MSKKILKHLKATAIGLGMLTVCSVAVLAVATPLVWVGDYYPWVIAGAVVLFVSWVVGMCYLQ